MKNTEIKISKKQALTLLGVTAIPMVLGYQVGKRITKLKITVGLATVLERYPEFKTSVLKTLEEIKTNS